MPWWAWTLLGFAIGFTIVLFLMVHAAAAAARTGNEARDKFGL